MEKIKRRRTPLRSSFTKTLNILKTELEKEDLEKGILLDNLNKLEGLMTELKAFDNEILDIMSEDSKCDEALIIKEAEESEAYSDEFITVKRLINEKLNSSVNFNYTGQNKIESETNLKTKRYKLPKLAIKKFDSKLINYLPFWAQFKKIHEDEELDNADKFQYLLQCVEPGTRARELLESYPVTSENYLKAVKAFEERYGDKDILIEVYVREFLKLITANVQTRGNSKNLCNLVTKIEAHLRSLESMGVNIDQNSAWLYPMVESCLPEDIIRTFQRLNVGAREDSTELDDKETTQKSNLSLLLNFLKREVAGEERLQLARSGFEINSPRENVKNKFHKRDNRVPTATGLFAAKELSCIFCGKTHESKDCITARSLSLDEKKNKVKEKNCCLKCLRFGHRAKTCKVFIKCHVCSKPHTELFCPEIRKGGENSRSKPPEVIQNTVAKQCSQEIALMTLEINIKGEKGQKRVRCLMDCGSQKSYILKKTAKELKLKPIGTEVIAHTVFGGTQIEAKQHNKFRVTVGASNNWVSSIHQLDLLDQEKICGEIPRIPKGNLCRELKKNKLWLSDIGPGSTEIEILIGSDVYGQLLTGRVKQLENGLTAIETKLGWTVCGKTGLPSQGCLNSGTAVLMTNLYIKDWNGPDLKRLETIGINDPAQILSKRDEEEQVHDMFLRQLTRNVTSVNNTSELEEFKSKATEIMAEAKMDLRLWQFGPVKEIEKLSLENEKEDFSTPIPVLGIKWDRTDDSLMVCNKFDLEIVNPSKRQILSITQGIFDPIGFLAPALLPAKIIIQESWSSKSAWDTPLPEKIQRDFQKWYSELKQLTELKIPRRIGYGNKEDWTLHIFCDASQSAYATVIFLRCEEEKRVSIQFLGAKSRLAPKKALTIPRLELLACVLGSRLSKYVVEALDIPTVPTYFWTDSSTVLAWIKRNDQWGTFVGNRIREICQLTNPQQWYLVPGSQNPADLPSRGCSPKYLLESGWWEGPKWLEDEKSNWPQPKIVPNEVLVMSERKKTAVSLFSSQNVDPFMNYERTSKFSKLVNIICWIRRFATKCRNRNHIFPAELSAEEKEEAEKFLWSRIQLESFGDVRETIKGLVVMKDQDNILRVKTKLLDREDTFSFKYPILLPSKHHVVRCLIRDCHLKNCHAGLQTVGSILREHYWIISAKRNIRSELIKCTKCKIFSSKPFVTPPIHLPFDRVRDSKVFEVVGIDLCGPLYLKNKSKVWIVIFTCAVYRAIHLELVTNLSTEGFIQALRRFVARRGRISTIYSDNGTNFRGANNLFKSLDWNQIQKTDDIAPIKWKFIPPTAAWWGGWWERLIRSVKNLLLRTLGKSSLNFEDLSTILCEVEAIMNSRPLTYLSEEPDKFIPLTPSCFMQDIQEIGVPDLDAIDAKKLRARYKHCQSVRKQLQSRFRKEYLAQLVQRSRQICKPVKQGDIVLVEINSVKRLHWPIGRVVKIFPSRDGRARVVEVKMHSGTLIRPLQKLYPLEISDAEDPVIQAAKETIN